MIRLMAEKVQKISERVGFPSGNIQIKRGIPDRGSSVLRPAAGYDPFSGCPGIRQLATIT